MDGLWWILFNGLLLLGALLGLALMIVGILVRSKRTGAEVEVEIPGMGKIKTKHTGIVILFAGILMFSFSINSFYQKSRLNASNALITSENTLTAILKSSVISDGHFQAQVKYLDKDVQNKVILMAARVLANEYGDATKISKKFDAADFAHIEQLIAFLYQMDRNNGHALYFSGEVKRLLRQSEQSISVFYVYLETEKDLPVSEKGGGKEIKLCTERVHGYCKQRTGWIQHRLANYFLEKAQNEQYPDIKRQYNLRALEYSRQARENYPPEGFEQLIPTVVVEKRATEALQSK